MGDEDGWGDNTSNTRENGNHATGEPATNSLGKSGTQNAREAPARTHTPNANRSVRRPRRRRSASLSFSTSVSR